jgi:hypothetical protein
MKFGYRDRIILMIAIIVVILGLGIFLLIKPKWEKLNENKQTRETLKTAWDSKMIEFDRIPLKQDNIQKRYETGKVMSEKFTPEMDAIELDKFLQDKFMNNEKFQEDEVELVDNVVISEKGTSALSYYYFTPNIVTYPLYENADLDGSLAAAAAEKLADSRFFASRSTQTVGASNAVLVLNINREDTMSFIDAVNDYAAKNNDTMMIDSIVLEECNFNEDLLPKTDEDGNEIKEDNKEQPENNNGGEAKKGGYTKATISYRVFYMQEPMKPDVGPAYDKTIWDGDAWRTAVAE